MSCASLEKNNTKIAKYKKRRVNYILILDAILNITRMYIE